MASNNDEQNEDNTKRYITRVQMNRPNGQNFLYKYRWVIVLVLGLLLMYYIHSRSCMDNDVTVIELDLNRNQAFRIPGLSNLSNTLPFDTDRRRLFNL